MATRLYPIHAGSAGKFLNLPVHVILLNNLLNLLEHFQSLHFQGRFGLQIYNLRREFKRACKAHDFEVFGWGRLVARDEVIAAGDLSGCGCTEDPLLIDEILEKQLVVLTTEQKSQLRGLSWS